MSYATVEDFIMRTPASELAFWQADENEGAEESENVYQNEKIERLLADASAQMDAWCGSVPAEVPAVYTLWCCEIARYLAMQTTSELDEQAAKRLDSIQKDLQTMNRAKITTDTNTDGSTTNAEYQTQAGDADLLLAEPRHEVPY